MIARSSKIAQFADAAQRIDDILLFRFELSLVANVLPPSTRRIRAHRGKAEFGAALTE